MTVYSVEIATPADARAVDFTTDLRRAVRILKRLSDLNGVETVPVGPAPVLG